MQKYKAAGGLATPALRVAIVATTWVNSNTETNELNNNKALTNNFTNLQN